ncbi:hypothetical protein R3P88_003543 [Salmonella enterica]|uniref:Uncharacterized protein n=1 Tax=Salmonella enterica TaxID=28901 RepID=A0A3V7YZM2_SALER|nr:hypothetical protein [Salmonella enterica]AXC67055.1 hypothetical protein DOE63_16930 [Salmonella enterica subsp. diarizonae serovar 59:z10:-]EBE3720404.1 hypothetical protein [Salmonella enterica subsp. diarizonae serovar 42:l,v:1,5,7]EBY1050027.1 hypothetical protein [Salmonella enterica subsp. enterica serovar Bareilly]EBZ6325697.1 hypothetical protein [Salmonella enterica subsp. enterica serovar Gaminara]ECF1389157.1 hypothetical protein [Salmonella enterica subsp. enterica serovar Stan
MSEAIINSEQAAQFWPLPDVDLTNLDLFSRGFLHQILTDLRRHHGALFRPRTALMPDGEGFWVFTLRPSRKITTPSPPPVAALGRAGAP